MGFKRSEKRMKDIELKLRAGMDGTGSRGRRRKTSCGRSRRSRCTGSRSRMRRVSRCIAYASAYLKCHYLAAFTCALLNNQPMGFYRPAMLIKDAQRHGLRVLPVDVTRSEWKCTSRRAACGSGCAMLAACARGGRRSWRARPPAVRLASGLRGPQRPAPRRAAAEVGALNAFGLTRRSALWQVEKAGRPSGPLLREQDLLVEPSPVPELDLAERLASDLVGTGLCAGPHPISLPGGAGGPRRSAGAGAASACGRTVGACGGVRDLPPAPGNGERLPVLTLEDETGLVNVIVRPRPV